MDSARYKELEICNLRHAAWEIPVLPCKGGQMLTVIMTLQFLPNSGSFQKQNKKFAACKCFHGFQIIVVTTLYQLQGLKPNLWSMPRLYQTFQVQRGPDLHHHRVSTTSVLAVQSLFTLFCEGVKDSLATHVHPHVPRLYPYGCFNPTLTSYSSTQLYCVSKDLHCHGRKCIIWDIMNCPLSTSCFTGISINHLKFLN